MLSAFTPNHRRTIVRLAFLLSTLLLLSAALACGPVRGGGGSNKCESEDDCDSDQYCDIDEGETKGKCRSLDTNNGANNGVNNGATNNGANNGVVNNGVNNGATNNGVVNNGVVNNGTTNNGVVNNGTTNNGAPFTEAACTNLCSRIVTCPQFADCDGATISQGLQQCNTFCGDPGTRSILEPYADASCATLFEFASGVVDTSSCGGPVNNGQPTFCEQVCDNLITCTNARCPGAIVDNCVEICNGDPDPEGNLGQYLNATCTSIQSEFCIDANDTNAGAACTTTSQCNTGNLTAICITDGQGWPGGYCTAECRAHAECGEGNVCLTLGSNGETYCTQGCDRAADCRSTYACYPLDGATRNGVCLPRCTTSDDCVSPATCNTSTGVCE